MEKQAVLLAVALFAVFNIQLYAAPVNATKAKTVAINHLKSNSRGLVLQSADNLNLVYQSKDNTTEPSYYVFGNDKSFVVVAGDDKAMPILGYSVAGGFDAVNIPPAMADLLKEYDAEIKYARSQTTSNAEIEAKWSEYTALSRSYTPQANNPTSTNYLIKTNWNQWPIYNNLCPVPGSGTTSTPTGCVATAMAQIMRYWWVDADVTNYCRPSATGFGSYSYTPTTHPEYGVQSANFGATTYDYANMPVSVNASSPAAAQQAVAQLMYHCGVSVDMDYDVGANGGSGASIYNASIALNKYFGYINSKYVVRTDYSASDWLDILQTEIKNDRPIIYSGTNASKESGHAWVCDGYDLSNYFHMNWGWGGASDGWFLLTALTPDSYNFSYNNSAVINIHPKCAYDLPICEDFDSYPSGNANYPNDWQRITTYSRNYPYIYGSTHFGTSGNSLFFYASKGYYNIAVLPLLNVSSVNGLSVSFAAYANSIDSPSIEIGVMTDSNDASTFTPIDTATVLSANTWQNFVIPFSAYSGSGKYIAFRYSPASSINSFCIDNVSVQSCNAINIKVSDIDGSSAKISWTNIGSLNSVSIEYGVKGFVRGSGTVVTTSGQSYTLTGLQPSTAYDFYVTTSCSGQNCNLAPQYTFTTATDLPICEDFESYAQYSLPDNWQRLTNYVPYNLYPYPYVYNDVSFSHNSNKSMLFTASMGTYSIGILPLLNVSSINPLSISFWAYSQYDSSSSIDVGVMTDPTNAATFELVQTININLEAEWERFIVPFSNYTGTGKYIAFRYEPSTRSNFNIDDVSIQTCGVDSIKFSDIKGNAAKVSWTKIGSPTSVEIEYGPSGFVQGQGTSVTVTGTSYTLTGLNVASDYDVYVQSTCSNGQNCNNINNKHTFTTAFDIPICDNFDSYQVNSLPDKWTRLSSKATDVNVYDLYSHSKANTLRFYCTGTSHGVAVSPALNVSSVQSLHVSFWAYAISFFVSGLEVGVMTDPTDESTFTMIQKVNLSQLETWQFFSVSLANYTGNGKYVAFRYKSDTGSSSYMYIDDLSISTCGVSSVSATTSTHSAIIKFPTFGQTSVELEYGISGFKKGSGTKVTFNGNASSYEIKNLACGTKYDAYVSITESSCGCTEIIPYTFVTKCCAIEPPHCENFDALSELPFCYNISGDVLLSKTNSHTQGQSLLMYSNSIVAFPELNAAIKNLYLDFWAYTTGSNTSTIEIGTMSDPANDTTFTVFQTLTLSNSATWEQKTVSFATYTGTDKYIAIRRPSSVSLYIDDISISKCPSAVNITSIDNIGTTYATVNWTGSATDVIVEYGKAGFARGTGTTAHVAGKNSYRMSGLVNMFAYEVYVYSDCGNNDYGCSNDSRRFNLLIPSCLDFTDLHASNVTCRYGSFTEPYKNVGVVDSGYASSLSRHTIHTDVNEKDERTNYQLSTVPPGGTASVRLGNWDIHAEAESVSYDYTVDASANPVLLFQYAAVMQDPLHYKEQQPRLTLEILDSSGNLINPTCGSFDFISSPTLGWNSVGTGTYKVYWKDWTTIGLDLTPYDGQTIKIRMTTYDCSQGGHYGYAYFAFKCAERKVEISACGNSNTNVLTAPDGFVYSWYSSKNSTPFSTQQSVTVPVDGSTYYCDLSYAENSECKFTIQANADSRFPIADFSYSKKSSECADTITFENKSGVSSDGINLNTPLEKCDYAHWDFGNGQISDDYVPLTPIIYTASGTYKVKLTASLAGECTDFIEKEINVVINKRASTFKDTICQGESFSFGGKSLTQSGTYNDTIVLPSGCDSIVTLNLTVNPNVTPTFADVATEYCEGSAIPELPTISDNNISGTWQPAINNMVTTTYTFTPDAGQCAVMTTLTIKINEFPHPKIVGEIEFCEGGSVVLDAGNGYSRYKWSTGATTQTITVNAEGKYVVTVANGGGCEAKDSIEIREKKRTYSEFSDEACDFYYWSQTDKTYELSGSYQDTLTNFAGCDSIITLKLTIHNSTKREIDTMITSGSIYDKHGFNKDTEGVYYQCGVNEYGCPDTLVLNLKVMPAIQMPNAIDPSDNSFNYYTQRYRNQFGPIIGERNKEPLDEHKYEYKMMIFNRWNVLIFEANKAMDESIDPAKHYWDGTYKGKILKEDAYLFYIKIKLKNHDKDIDKKGTVSIIYK